MNDTRPAQLRISRDAYARVPMITRLVADNKLSQDEIEKLHRILEEEI